MTIFIISTELEGGGRSDVSVEEVTTAGRFNSALQRSAVRVGSSASSNAAVTYNFTAISESWLHLNVWWSTFPATTQLSNAFITVRGSSGDRVRMRRVGGTSSGPVMLLETWSSGVWVERWRHTFNEFALTEMDLQVRGGTTGRVAMFLDGVLARSWEGAIDLPAEMNQIVIGSVTGSATLADNMHISQVMIADEITTGLRAYQRVPSGAGAVNDWTGVATDINELITDDGTFLASNATNQVALFTLTSLSIPQGRVRAVAITMRAQNSVGTPDNLQGAVRISGTNYFTANIPAVTAGWTNLIAFFNTDPSTGLPWARAAAENAALQAGVRSQT